MIRTLKIHQVFGHVNAYRVEDDYQESLDSLRAQLTADGIAHDVPGDGISSPVPASADR